MRLARRLRFAFALLPLLALLAACGDDAALPRVRLASGASPKDSGLLEYLKPEIRRVAKVELFSVGVGTGLALEYARKGDADLVLVHDREREDGFIAEGWGIDARDVMWNDFVLLGPADDPAQAKGKGAAAALAAIAQAGAKFVSRGDKSGTHSRELSLWKKAGVAPGGPGYVETGQGQGPTMLIAHEKRAYVLTDRGTFQSMKKKLDLAILVEGDPALLNPYRAILVNVAKVPGVNAAGARAVLDYLTSPAGQARVGAFQVDGTALFHPGAPPK